MTDLSRWMDLKDAETEAEIDDTPNEVPIKMPTNADLPGACRVQSPSSILTHRQCPRKYYYRYIERLPGGKSIHLVRGVVVHQVLEDIYDVDFSQVPSESFLSSLKYVLQEAFLKEWAKASDQLAELDMSPEEIDEYRDESKLMVDNFYHHIYDRMLPLLETMSAHDAWKELTPEREIQMQSPQNLVRGYIDVVENHDDKVAIIDYKTSKKLQITEDYKLQLGIYAMMHEELRKPADEVGILFLKHGQELRIPVTPELVENARTVCTHVQLHTRSTNPGDYPMRTSPLCKWRSGQCEYYELCFEGESVAEYRERMNLKR